MKERTNLGRPRLIWALLAAAAVFLLSPAAGYGATIAVYDDPNFVDTTDPAPGAESDNVQASLASFGHTIKTFTGTSGPAFSGGLAGAGLLVIPELENGDLGAALNQDALHTIRSYVATGGGLIMFDLAGGNTTAFLNTVFGYNLAAGGGGPYSRTGEVAGTAFAGGPTSLPDNDATETLNTASLPSGASAMWANGAAAAVTAFTVGSGEIVHLGWDWFDAAPVGAQAGGWLNVLNRAVSEVAGAGCTITGTPGGDVLTGTGGRDRICARGGNDVINAGSGNDVIFAGKGHDSVNGQGGRDTILLEVGNDTGFGSAGRDRIVGGSGADTLNGRAGNDFLDARDGVRGNDRANGGPGNDRCRRDRRDRVSSC